jgi:predicted RNA binding protein YcfA (HicA-like mRNA interferase family)
MSKRCVATTAYFFGGKGTSHAHAKHPAAREILTIPARRPIKPVYIRKLIRY